MKPFKLHHKIIAIVLTLAFTFQSMSQINEHTYSVNGGVFICGSMMCDPTPSHLSYYCDFLH